MWADPWRKAPLFLLVLTALLFLPRLGVRDLWPPDEARFAVIAEDMVRGGSWVAPDHLGRTYSEKPPLQLWAVALASLPAGKVSETSARLPSVLAALGSVLLTFFLGRRLLGPSAGLAGALVLLTSGHFVARARWSCTDTLLAFFVLAALACAYVWMDTLRRRWPAALGFFACCALATLTKGPVGVVLPAAVVVLSLVLEGRWRDALRFPWIPGGAVFLVAVVPWYLAFAMAAGEGHLTTVLVRENIARFLQAWNNVQPWWFYFGRFPLSFLPWAVFLPAAAWAAIRLSRPEERPALRFLAIWFGVLFTFFSASSGKRTVYLLPLFPATALLVGWTLAVALPRAGRAAGMAFRLSAAPLLLLVVVAAIAVPMLLVPLHAAVRGPAVAACAIFALGAVALAVPVLRGRPVPFLAGTVALMVALTVLSEQLLLPRLNAYQNFRQSAALLAATVPPGGRVASAEPRREVLFFYSGLRGPRVESAADVVEFLSSPGPAYCVLPAGYWERWRTDVAHASARPFAVMAEDPFVLVTNGRR